MFLKSHIIGIRRSDQSHIIGVRRSDIIYCLFLALGRHVAARRLDLRGIISLVISASEQTRFITLFFFYFSLVDWLFFKSVLVINLEKAFKCLGFSKSDEGKFRKAL